MKKQSNTPHIRLQNYEDEWDVEKLKNIFGTIRNAFVGTATPYYVENGNFYLESNNVKNGKINYNSQIFINDEFYEKQRDKWLKTNDIVMVQSGHVGHTAVIPEELNNTAAHALIVFTDYKKEVNPHFLNYQFQSNDKRKGLDLISTGNTIKHILASEMKNFKMDFPTSEEQSAIGSLFRTINDLLASYKDNLINYQSLKATMLSKMFPKVGQTVPEIRLDGFEGEWENKILSEVTNITMGQSPKSENYTDNPNDYILVQGNADIKDKQVVPRLWTTEVTKTAEIGDIILTVRAPVGDIGKTDYNVVIGRGVAAIKGNDFIFYTLEKMKMTGFWNRFSTGSTFESISSNDIKEAIIQIPTLEEQQAIGAYFLNLDNFINSHQEKISQIETLKKKLLQDMFI